MIKFFEGLDDQCNQLYAKSTELKQFINNSPEFKDLSDSVQTLLVIQYKTLQAYIEILDAISDEVYK
jgi:hypothetical protein